MKLEPNFKTVEVRTSGKAIILVGLCLFLFLFVAGGAWAWFTQLSGAVIAQGQVVVIGKPKTVQHLDGGIVSRLTVKDGDHVKKDDVLIRLDDTILKANLNVYQSRLLETVALKSRLVAERDGNTSIVWDTEITNLFDLDIPEGMRQGQERLFHARQQTNSGRISQLKARIDQYQSQISGITEIIRSKQSQLAYLDEELEGKRILGNKNIISKPQVMLLEREREETIGELAEQRSEKARLHNAIAETGIEIEQVTREFVQSVLTELRQSEHDIHETIQQLHTTREQLRRVEITAPVSGIIHELKIFTIGGVINPGTQVMQIIPQRDEFEIEANIEPQFIDEVYSNQPAVLRFSAFNQRTTPEINAKTTTISPNVVINEQTGMPFYKVSLHVTKDELRRLNGQTLVPGMPVEVFIKTKDRSVLSYFVKPFLDQVSKMFKE